MISDREHDAFFRIHGEGVLVRSHSPSLAQAAEDLVRHFRVRSASEPSADEPSASERGAGLRMVLREVAEREQLPRRSRSADILWEEHRPASGETPAWDCTISKDASGTMVELSGGALVFDEGRGRVEGWAVAPHTATAEEREDFVYVALTELLRRKGLYAIHAAAVERQGVGVLVPADSGRGKTTCLLALQQAGWRCLSDDHPLLRPNGAGVEMLPFPVRIELTPETVARFPHLPSKALRDRDRKVALYPEELGDHVIGGVCRPRLILFPELVDEPGTRVERLARRRALEELMRVSMLVLNPEVAARHFEMLGRLARDAACYRLLFGTDLGQLPSVVDAALASSA